MSNRTQLNLNLELHEAIARLIAPRLEAYNNYAFRNPKERNVVKYSCKKRVITYKSKREDEFYDERYEVSTPVGRLRYQPTDVEESDKELLQATFNENMAYFVNKSSPEDREVVSSMVRKKDAEFVENGEDQWGGKEPYTFERFGVWSFDRMYLLRMINYLSLVGFDIPPQLKKESSKAVMDYLHTSYRHLTRVRVIYGEWLATRQMASVYYEDTTRSDMLITKVAEALEKRGEFMHEFLEHKNSGIKTIIDELLKEEQESFDKIISGLEKLGKIDRFWNHSNSIETAEEEEEEVKGSEVPPDMEDEDEDDDEDDEGKEYREFLEGGDDDFHDELM